MYIFIRVVYIYFFKDKIFLDEGTKENDKKIILEKK